MNHKSLFVLFSFFALGFFQNSFAADPQTKTAAVAVPSITLNSGNIEFFGTGKPSQLKIHGESKGVAGTLQIQAQKVSGSFTCKMDTFETGMKLRDSHLKEKIFDVAKNPESTLTLTSLDLPSAVPGDWKALPFKGKLKFHAVEKEIDGTVDFKSDSTQTEFTAETTIKLTDFGITPPEFMGMAVQDPVKIKVHGIAK